VNRFPGGVAVIKGPLDRQNIGFGRRRDHGGLDVAPREHLPRRVAGWLSGGEEHDRRHRHKQQRQIAPDSIALSMGRDHAFCLVNSIADALSAKNRSNGNEETLFTSGIIRLCSLDRIALPITPLPRK
jgi:hypothetical protein